MGGELGKEEKVDVTEELSWLLEIGRLLASVLTPEEIESLRILLTNSQSGEGSFTHPGYDLIIGNTSVT